MKTRLSIIIIPILLIAALGLLAWRLFYLQNVLSGYIQKTSLKQRYAVITEKPQRGVIVDSKGRILAASNRLDTVFAEPRAVRDVKSVANELQQILNVPGHEICSIILESKNPGFAEIKTGISESQRNAIKKESLEGIGIQSNWHRFYPAGSLASHIVGFTGIDENALAGLELKYDYHLTGTQASNTLFIDVSRRPIGMKPGANLVKDGFGLILTIDTAIQQFANAALLRQLNKYHAESAIAIVMDPWTGAVLAIVSLPDFDPQDLNSTNQNNLKNRALTDPFEPGSVFKPIVTAIALDAGIIDYEDVIFCEKGSYNGKGFAPIGEWAGHQFSDLTIRQILVNSSNIGMAKIGQKTGKQKLYQGVRLFGFGAKTGIDLPGEDIGFLYPVRKWTTSSVTRVPYGHEISVTAIQIARAYCTLANGGRIVDPYIVRAAVDDKANITEMKNPPSLTGHIIKPQVAEWIVKQALTGVVNEGTGKLAASKKYQVFGKTGTANIAIPGGKGYDETNYVASFAGGAPADKPEIVVVVSIRKPDKSLGKGYSGGRVAAPVFKEIVEETLTYLHQQ